MTFWMTLITPILVMTAITCVMMQRQHLLMTLLALETMILTLVLLMVTLMNSAWFMTVIVMLTFGACEASLGLACMTAMSRSYGNDHMNLTLINKC